MMEREKHVDESWKDTVAKEKETGGEAASVEGASKLKDVSASANSTDSRDEKTIQPDVFPEVNFFNYASSLMFQAMIFMGELENPVTEKIEENLAQAKLLIDTLIMLREKTKGNLTGDEARLIDEILASLRLAYVKKTRDPKRP